jgi:hypothetical protein
MDNIFNANTYRKLNLDLNHLSDKELKRQFFTEGIRENRQYQYILPPMHLN